MKNFKKGALTKALYLPPVDISVCIQDLLWEQDCVVVPGLGGFLCRYREAQHHPVSHQWSPPSKSVTFNSALKEDDGLLIVAYSRKNGISYQEAATGISKWVALTHNLLAEHQEITFPGIGKIFADMEGNLQFVSAAEANFLAASFGLPEFKATPLLKKEEARPIPVIEMHRPSVIRKPRQKWAMAAAILLLLSLGAVIGLLTSNITIPALELNQASVLEVFDQWQPSPQWSVQPKSTATVLPEAEDWNYTADLFPSDTSVTAAALTETDVVPTLGPGYYVMIGAFKENANVEHAETFIQQHFPGAVIYKDTSPYFVRIGFRAGDNYRESLQKLQEARQFDTAFWLLKGR